MLISSSIAEADLQVSGCNFLGYFILTSTQSLSVLMCTHSMPYSQRQTQGSLYFEIWAHSAVSSWQLKLTVRESSVFSICVHVLLMYTHSVKIHQLCPVISSYCFDKCYQYKLLLYMLGNWACLNLIQIDYMTYKQHL